MDHCFVFSIPNHHVVTINQAMANRTQLCETTDNQENNYVWFIRTSPRALQNDFVWLVSGVSFFTISFFLRDTRVHHYPFWCHNRYSDDNFSASVENNVSRRMILHDASRGTSQYKDVVLSTVLSLKWKYQSWKDHHHIEKGHRIMDT